MADRGEFPKSNGDETFDTDLNTIRPHLGEIRMFALSIAGAVSKATLQTAGWAICDGTTPSSQGISNPDIATTPNLEEKFLYGSDDETSGTTGGAESHTHGSEGSGTWTHAASNAMVAVANLPPYYELVFFMKVKMAI